MHVNVVVLAESNNPRLLNRDFLQRNKIVPENWTATNVIVTPPFATVPYEQGLTISVEETKLQFAVDATRLLSWDELLPGVVIRYLEVLPHVAYRAVGLNYTLISDDPFGEAAENILITSMLKSGDWLNFYGGITGVNLDLQYRKAQPYLSLRIAVRERVGGERAVLEGFMVVANYHHDFTPRDVETRAAFIRQLSAKNKELQALIKQLPLRAQ